MNTFSSAPVTLSAGWALAMNLSGDGVAKAGSANGYVGTSAVTAKAIRATTYAPQGANAQRSVNSTSANDAAAGTGARTVTIWYFNTSWQYKSETVTLNGTSAVNMVATDVALIESIQVATVGSTGGNAGTIQVWTATGATGSVWASIAPADNQTFWCHHYVPSGVTCYVLSMGCGALATVGTMNLNRSGDPFGTALPQLQIGPTLPHATGDKRDHYFEVPIAVVGPDLIWMTTKPNATTADTSYGYFDYIQAGT